jgi:HEPN domain-containing protein
MANRSGDWLKQAARDLEQAEESRGSARHEWACFAARSLDNFHVPTRYPNGHPAGAPFEHYGPLQSGQAVDYAREILEFVRHQMA